MLTKPEDYFPPQITTTFLSGNPQRSQERESHKQAARLASSEAAAREMAQLAAMNPPAPRRVEPKKLRGPDLPENFGEQIAELDRGAPGISVDRDKLIELGQARFLRLLELDKDLRTEQRVITINTDLSDFGSVHHAFAQVNGLTTSVPRSKTAEHHSGAATGKEKARQITSWRQLWKITSEPLIVRKLYRYHDLFEQLLFAKKLLSQIGDDGRSGPATAGSLEKLSGWEGILRGPYFKVALTRPLWTVLSWVTGEAAPFPDPIEEAKRKLGFRAPDPAQVTLAGEAFDAFLRGYDGWPFWSRIGDACRKDYDFTWLNDWRLEFCRRYPAVTRLQADATEMFLKPASYGCFMADTNAIRDYLDDAFAEYEMAVSGIVALAINETHVAAARSHDSLLVQGEPDKHFLERIQKKLGSAFPNAHFQIAIKE